MDLATILGIISGFSLVIIAMGAGGGIGWFINGPSAMIVLGGTLGAILINYPLRDLLGVLKVAKNVFLSKLPREKEIVAAIIFMARHTRRNGILSIESAMNDKGFDPWLKKALMLVVDGLDQKDIKNILRTEINFIEERHRLGAEIFTSMGNFAPAMGMMGTLIGLVKMLMYMNDPANIGPSMAVALVTTFYGVILANLVFLPIAGKLKNMSSQELLIKQLILQGVLSIQSGDNPQILEEKLNSFISPGERRRQTASGVGNDQRQ